MLTIPNYWQSDSANCFLETSYPLLPPIGYFCSYCPPKTLGWKKRREERDFLCGVGLLPLCPTEAARPRGRRGRRGRRGHRSGKRKTTSHVLFSLKKCVWSMGGNYVFLLTSLTLTAGLTNKNFMAHQDKRDLICRCYFFLFLLYFLFVAMPAPFSGHNNTCNGT